MAKELYSVVSKSQYLLSEILNVSEQADAGRLRGKVQNRYAHQGIGLCPALCLSVEAAGADR